MVDIDRASIALFSSRLLSHAIGFVSVIYFARVLGASNLGIYFTFHTVVNILSVFSEFGVPGAVVKRISQSESEKQRAAYLSGAFALSAVILGLVTVLTVLFRSQLISFTDLSAAVSFLVLVLAANTGDRLMISVLRGERRVAVTAWVELFGQIVRVGLSVALLLAGFGVLALVYGLAARNIAQTAVAFGLADTGFAMPSRDHLTSLFGFSKYTAGMDVSNLAYNWTDTLVLAALASKAAVGVYEVAWQISMVAVLGARVIGIALAPTVTRWHEDGAITRIESAFTDGITFACLLVVPAFAGAIVLGDDVLRILYQYRTGATVLVILMAGQIPQAVKNITQNTLFGIDQPDKVFWTNLLTVTANVMLNVLLVPVYGMIGAAIATFLTAGVAAVSQLLYLRLYISLSANWTALRWQVVIALGMAAVVSVLSTVISPSTEFGLLTLVGIGVLIYGSGILVNDHMRRRFFDTQFL